MCLRFVFLLVTRLAPWSWLCRREESWKDAEILLLRHQLIVLRRRTVARPKLSWADRALVAALLGMIPRDRRASLRMAATPATVLRWHRDIVRRRWAARSQRERPGAPPRPAAISVAWYCAWPARIRGGATAGFTVS